MADDGYLQRARNLIETRPDRAAAFAPHLYTVESIPRRDARFAPAADPDGPEQGSGAAREVPALVEERRAAADADPLAAYAGWRSIARTAAAATIDPSRPMGPLPQLRDTPIVRYRVATCSGPESEPLTALLEQQSRYVEITSGWPRSRRAADRLRRWNACLASPSSGGPMAGGYRGDRERGVRIRGKRASTRVLDGAIALAPDHPEALIGRIKALTCSGAPRSVCRHRRRARRRGARVSRRGLYWRAWNSPRFRISTWPGPPSNRPTACG